MVDLVLNVILFRDFALMRKSLWYLKMITGIINEEWRSVSGLASYQVSNIGRVRKLPCCRIIKARPDTCGRLQVNMFDNRQKKLLYVHRLVAREFIENLGNTPIVDHIDGDKANNCASNLRYATISENAINKKPQKTELRCTKV